MAFEVNLPDGTSIKFGTPDFQKRYPISAAIIRGVEKDANDGKGTPPAAVREIISGMLALEYKVASLRNEIAVLNRPDWRTPEAP